MKEVIPGINYEVALEMLGNAAQPFIQAREEERKKSYTNEAFIQYCSDRIKAITVFRHNLRATDEDVIARILDPNDTIVGGSV